MVIGLDKFRQQFEGEEDKYVIIGGTACDVNQSDTKTAPRDTVDIDIILVVENITADFGRKFWNFIKEGDYQNRSRKRGDGLEHVPELYRFLRPTVSGFPMQLELLSIQPDVLGVPTGFHLTPIPFGEAVPSLSAIIMDKEFYEFTLKHRIIKNGLSIADYHALICLKATAFVNLLEQKYRDPSSVQSHDIRKHRDDVFKRLASLEDHNQTDLTPGIKAKISAFADIMETSCNDPSFLKSMRQTLMLEKDAIIEYIELLKELFEL